MIKFSLRPNLVYPLQYLIYHQLRSVETKLIKRFYNFSASLILTALMFMGELIFGLIFYLRQKRFVTKNKINEKKAQKHMYIELIKTENRLRGTDSVAKIIFIIFTAASFDFVEFLVVLKTPNIINVSISITDRLRGFMTIISALFYYYILLLPIYRHQLVSLIIIGICLLIVIITEYIFQEINIFISYGRLTYVFAIALLGNFFRAELDSNEKYNFEYNKVNPFYALMLEGFFGFTFTCIYWIFEYPFKGIVEVYENCSPEEFIIFILCLIIYIVLSGFKNAYRVITTKIYSPMTSTSQDYILNPIEMIINLTLYDDFQVKKEINYLYFSINFILALIITFFGFVYNEFIILFFCNLERDTHKEISLRAFRSEANLLSMIEMNDIDDED